jgi:pimeloyl-ACP methyl ester carboxylesterase
MQRLPTSYSYPHHWGTYIRWVFTSYAFCYRRCGQRLAAEVEALKQAHPGLLRISFIGHSMGGLICRHAAGLLYDAGSGTVAGLRPAHFITMATPHLGCETGPGPAQVGYRVLGETRSNRTQRLCSGTI